MATAYSNPFAVAGKAYAQGAARDQVTLVAILALLAAQVGTINNTIDVMWLPKGFTVTGLRVDCTDVDTGSAAITWDLGDAGSATRYLSADTVGQSAGSTTSLQAGGFLYKNTAKTKLVLKVHAAAATGADGTMKIAMHGFVDEDWDTTPLTVS